ncbi:hypothetical protein Tco_0186013 [Tanacetum coccineum]
MKGRSLWDVTVHANAIWGWRKILQIRKYVRPHVWYRIGDGKDAFAWFDRWAEQCPLMEHVLNRNITSSGFSIKDKVAILEDVGWTRKMFSVQVAWDTIRVHRNVVGWYHTVWSSPTIHPTSCVSLVASHGKGVKNVWLATQMADLPSIPPIWDDIIAWIVPISKSKTVLSVVGHLVHAAASYYFKELTDLLIPIVLNPCPDRWFWSLEGSGEFSVASIRRFIDDQRLLTMDSKTLWIKSVPIKVNILAWKIKLEALPTRFNISRRVRQIARKICSWWDIEYSDVNSFTEWINWMASLRLQSKVKMMIQGVFFVVWWLVWSYRNKLLFEEKKPSKAIIFDDVVSISFYWCKSRCKASFSWDDWLKNPSLISL